MTQERALSILKTGANIFLTGEPGSGKTHTVNQYIQYLRDHGVEPSITASTGIAATHVGGLTIHSWSGIGIRDALSTYELDAMSEREALMKRIQACKVLVIDEISMLDGVILALVEKVLRTLRRSAEPFGGIQMVFVGDFFQLPPISKVGAARFAFDSEAWRSARPVVCYLSEQHRQEDEQYLQTLTSIRRGEVGEETYAHLETRKVEGDHVVEHITRLYTHNADVDRLNLDELGRIKEDERRFVMETAGNAKLLEGLIKNCLSPQTLILKVGAIVMFTKNNFESGYANGTLGTVVAYDHTTGKPIVALRTGKRIMVERMDWVIEDNGKSLARVTQFPLRLAWAITVHKSQGMSLDAALMDLSRAFEYGQGYVALSRVRTLAGLHLVGLNARALEVHPQILAVDSEFRSMSGAALSEFDALPPRELEKMQTAFLLSIGGTIEKKQKKGIIGVSGKPKKTLEDIRKKFPNAYRPWSDADSDELVLLFKKGMSQPELAKKFGRKTSAIFARLVMLGLLEDDRAPMHSR